MGRPKGSKNLTPEEREAKKKDKKDYVNSQEFREQKAETARKNGKLGGKVPEYEMTEEMAPEIEMLLTEERTEAEIAEYFGISPQTFNRCKFRTPWLRELVHKHRSKITDRIEKALCYTALGHKRKVKKPFMYNGEIIYAEYEEDVPPHTGSMALWLKSNRPEVYGDKQEQLIDGLAERLKKAIDMTESSKKAGGADVEE